MTRRPAGPKNEQSSGVTVTVAVMVMMRKVIIELPVAVYEILTHQSAGLMNWIS